MDFEQNLNQMKAPDLNKRSENMALASLILGIFAIITSGCIYSAIVCGSLGIIFALLSRGGEMTFTSKSSAGLALSAIGLLLTLIIYTVAFIFIINRFGGLDAFMQEYMKLYNGGSIEELYQSMGIIQ